MHILCCKSRVFIQLTSHLFHMGEEWSSHLSTQYNVGPNRHHITYILGLYHVKTTRHDDVIKLKPFPCYWSFVTGEFPAQRPVNERLSKQSWGWWFETSSCSLWRHCNGWRWWWHKSNRHHAKVTRRCSKLLRAVFNGFALPCFWLYVDVLAGSQYVFIQIIKCCFRETR